MLSCLLLLVESKLKGKFIQKFSEEAAKKSIYGHSTCYSSKMDVLFVGAEYQNVVQSGETSETSRMGAIYVYKFNSEQNEYNLIQTIYPPTDQFLQNEATQTIEKANNGWAEIRQMGSLLTVSEDGKQLIVGSPYSNTYRRSDQGSKVIVIDGTEYRFEKLEEVGAVLSYQYNDNTGLWEYKHTFIPKPDDMLKKNGLGRIGKLSPSGNTLCIAYYNKKLAQRNTQGKIFTVKYDSSTKSWGSLEEAPLNEKIQTFFEEQKQYINYGSSIEFQSETMFYIGVQVLSGLKGKIGSNSYPGIQVFNYNSLNGKWEWQKQILPIDPDQEKWSEYGTSIQLAGNSESQILAVDMKSEDNSNKMIILKKNNGQFSKENSQIFSFGLNFTSFSFYLGSSDKFISSSTSYKEDDQAIDNGAIRVYEINDDKQYESSLDALIPPEKDRHFSMLNFGCSVTWKDKDHAFIGAHHKEPGMGDPYDHPAVYLIELQIDNSKRNAIIIGCVVGGAVLITIIVLIIVYINHKKKKKNENNNEQLNPDKSYYL